MNKTNKRQLNIKNKLIAAIAMLLVSSIMMVSSTYAWFTLSTAPEVQGITTTVGANGNLEIALAHPTGNNNLIGTGINDSQKEWVEKNLTWGNLLDLSDESYALNELTLLPSRLNLIDTNALNGSPLMIPVYGADGRISALDGNKMNYGVKVPDTEGFLVNPTVQIGDASYPNYGYGVRALGTSSTQSETELNYQIALNAVNTYRGQAFNKATNAMGQEYGSALADIAVTHAAFKVSGTVDNADYKGFVSKLEGMVSELDAAADLVEKSLLNSLVAISNANIPYDNDKTLGEAEIEGKTVREYLKDATSLSVVWTGITGAGLETMLNDGFPAMVQAYNTWSETKTQISRAQNALEPLGEAASVSWSEISTILGYLMNLDYVTLSGKALDDPGLNKSFLIANASNLNLEMHDGSGVLANFGKLTGNLSSTVYTEKAEFDGDVLEDLKINLVTDSVPAAGPLLTQVRTTIAKIPAVKGNDSTTALDVIYGYVLDFVFRTNAANSNLLLQTEGAQRIYSDGTNAATMGHGSSMTFSAAYSNLESLINMMSGIRVVFTNTVGDSTEVYGIAKVVFEDLELPIALNAVTLSSKQIPAASEGAAATYEPLYTEGDASDAKVYLSTVENGNNVQMILKTGDHQYVFVEEYEDTTTDGKDYRWTVKTAMWYEKTTVTEGVNDAGEPVTTTVKEIIELTDNKGNLLFYPEKDLDQTTGLYDERDDAAKAAHLTTLTEINFGWDDNIHNTDAAMGTISEAVVENWAGPAYYAVHDAEVEVEAPLYLHNYTVENGVLNFSTPLAAQTLTALDQNVITGVSALVYLDGDYIDNGDVINSEDGISNSGTMNLQFASSANLVPMENTALKNGETYDVTINKPDGVDVRTTAEKASNGQDYTFALADNTHTVTYKVGADGQESDPLEGVEQTYNGQTGWVYTIPAAEVTDEITITIS